MRTLIRLTFLMSIMLISLLNNAFAQRGARKYLDVQLGLGFNQYDGFNTALGGTVLLGYRNELSNRTDFIPRLTYGYFVDTADDVPQTTINSIVFEAIFAFEIVKFRDLSVNLNTGPFASFTFGVKELSTGNDDFKENNLGISLSPSLVLGRPSAQYQLHFHPVNLRIGSNNYSEIFASIGFTKVLNWR